MPGPNLAPVYRREITAHMPRAKASEWPGRDEGAMLSQRRDHRLRGGGGVGPGGSPWTAGREVGPDSGGATET